MQERHNSKIEDWPIESVIAELLDKERVIRDAQAAKIAAYNEIVRRDGLLRVLQESDKDVKSCGGE